MSTQPVPKLSPEVVDSGGRVASPARFRVRTAISVTLAVAFVALAVWFLSRYPDELAHLRSASVPHLLAATFCMAANLTLNGYFTSLALEGLQIRVPLSDCLCLSYSATFSNQLLPLRAGLGLRAVYLKHLYHVPYTQFVGTVSAYVALVLLAHSVLGLSGVLLIGGQGGTVSIPVLACFVVVTIAAFAVLFLAPKVSASAEPASSALVRIAQGLQSIRRDARLARGAALTIFATVLCSCGAYYFLFAGLGFDFSPTHSVVITSTQVLSGQLTITPGAFGIQESFGMYLSETLPVTSAQTLIALGLARVLLIAVATLLGGPATVHLSRQLSRHSGAASAVATQ
jgi:uncharacterized membrane protein YbhN (UPF0104 family)